MTPYLVYVAARQEVHTYRCVLSLVKFYLDANTMPHLGQVVSRLQAWEHEAEKKQAHAERQYLDDMAQRR